MTCSTCKHWETIETHGSSRGDSGMLHNGYKNCLMNKKRGDNFAAYKFVHSTYTCKDHEAKK